MYNKTNKQKRYVKKYDGSRADTSFYAAIHVRKYSICRSANRMKNILLCAGSEKNLEALSALIRSFIAAEITAVTSAAEARRQIAEFPETDLVIVNTPLSDEQGVEMTVQMSENNSVPVVLVTGRETYERSGDLVKERGVEVICRPVDKKTFCTAVEAMLTAGIVMARLRQESLKLRESLDEISLVNRAKAMLISNLNMTEAQAHRYIEKQAMDLRQNRKVIAQNILKTYYNK